MRVEPTRAERIPASIEDVKELMLSTGSRFKEWTRPEIEGLQMVYDQAGLTLPSDVTDLLTDGGPLPDPRARVRVRTAEGGDQAEEIADGTLLEEARDMIRDSGPGGVAGMLALSYPTVERSRLDGIVDAAVREIEAEARAEVSIQIGEYQPSPSIKKIPRILNAATKLSLIHISEPTRPY